MTFPPVDQFVHVRYMCFILGKLFVDYYHVVPALLLRNKRYFNLRLRFDQFTNVVEAVAYQYAHLQDICL